MKKLLIIFLFIFSFGKAQLNLVPNYSFEDYNTSPAVCYYASYSYLNNWFSPTHGTPDLWSAKIFSNTDPGCNGYISAPLNGAGYQYAQKGKCYAGIISAAASYAPPVNVDSNYCEYISVKLKQTLKAGQMYCFSMWVNLADTSNLASAPLQVYFSSNAINQNIYTNLSYTP